jgi:CheY-like chemotaxis protein
MKKVLVVDDSWVARLGMKKILAPFGCEVFEANDGLQALSTVTAASPDLVFLDLLMPEVDGFEVLKRLKDQGRTVPVFVLSADIQTTTVTECLELGARGCLPKPPSREAVEEALRSAV